MAYGVCKLTGNSGQFVEAHLIPKSLTRPSVPGEYFISGGQRERPKKSWSSWYDKELVIQKGENILRDYDTWAIRELRRLKLVWSGWENDTSLPVETWFGPRPEGFGIRDVETKDPDKLRLFFLSLLWRAAATTLPELGEAALPPNELETLRKMVPEGNPAPLDFYPIGLLQLVSRGDIHNLSPFVEEYRTKYEGLDTHISAFRFYFDGLVVLVCKSISLDLEKIRPLIVGFSPALKVQAQAWERSFQLANMAQHTMETIAKWPDDITRLARIVPRWSHR
jgi:hypothetical protein